MPNKDGSASIHIPAETYGDLMAIRAVLEAETGRPVALSKAISTAAREFLERRGVTTRHVLDANGITAPEARAKPRKHSEG